MTTSVREQLDICFQQNLRLGNPQFTTEPPIFSLVKFLQDQGFTDQVINTTAISELNAKLMAEETRLTNVENNVIAQLQEHLQELTTLLPATAPLAEIFVAKNRAKFANCRNYARQTACQAALRDLPPPTARTRPSDEAKAVLRQFWDAGNTHPNVEQRIMLACHAHLTFNQVRKPFNRRREPTHLNNATRFHIGFRISAIATTNNRILATPAAHNRPHRASASSPKRRAMLSAPPLPPPPPMPPTHRQQATNK
jgi:hypothetical protein